MPKLVQGWSERSVPPHRLAIQPGSLNHASRYVGCEWRSQAAGLPESKPVLHASSRCSGVPWCCGLDESNSPTASARRAPPAARRPRGGPDRPLSWSRCRRSSPPAARSSSSARGRRRCRRGRARPGPGGRTRRRRRSRRPCGRSLSAAGQRVVARAVVDVARKLPPPSPAGSSVRAWRSRPSATTRATAASSSPTLWRNPRCSVCARHRQLAGSNRAAQLGLSQVGRGRAWWCRRCLRGLGGFRGGAVARSCRRCALLRFRIGPRLDRLTSRTRA